VKYKFSNPFQPFFPCSTTLLSQIFLDMLCNVPPKFFGVNSFPVATFCGFSFDRRPGESLKGVPGEGTFFFERRRRPPWFVGEFTPPLKTHCGGSGDQAGTIFSVPYTPFTLFCVSLSSPVENHKCFSVPLENHPLPPIP